MHHMTNSERLTSGQIAEMAGVHRTTVNYWHDIGALVPVEEINGTRIYLRADVERFLADRKAAAK